jgi:multidrug efflux pump subunit AcrA (membrane-fusion protein)
VKNDQGLIDSADLNLTYSKITSPISGRVGLRLVDVGNIVHATDTTGLLVITQLQPIAVDFSIPEDDLPRVISAMKNVAGVTGASDGSIQSSGPASSAALVRVGAQEQEQVGNGPIAGARGHKGRAGHSRPSGATVPVTATAATQGPAATPTTELQPTGLPVDAYDRDFKTKLATGTLLTTDNEIDQTTGTIKLKAQFPNEDNALFPNQFVNVRLLVDVKRGATLIPTAGIQRSSQGSFVYVVKPDQTVEMRVVKVGNTQGELSSLESGVQPGELVVVDGMDKLRAGSKVTVQLAANPITPGATQ